MRDEDEIYEAATEEPVTLGCPSLVPGKVVVHDEPGVDNDELQRKGEQLKACNDRSYAKMVRIAELANECVLKTTHAEYAPGQYGQDYREFGKTMCEIRELVGKSIADVAPDYEMLARELTRDGFDADRLAKAIEAEASKRPIDYPTFYTPGWLAELAKKMQGEHKAAKVAEWLHHHYSFCDGLFPIRRANCEKAVIEHCWICGRRFTMEMSRDIHDDGEHVCCAKIRDNGKLIAKCVVYRGKSIAEKMAHETFKAYVGNLSGSGRLSSRGGFLKQALKRTAAAKAVNATAKKGGEA